MEEGHGEITGVNIKIAPGISDDELKRQGQILKAAMQKRFLIWIGCIKNGQDYTGPITGSEDVRELLNFKPEAHVFSAPGIEGMRGEHGQITDRETGVIYVYKKGGSWNPA